MYVRFDRGALGVSLPGKNIIGVLNTPSINPIRDIKAALMDALDRPFATGAFCRLFREGHKVCILVSDITRTPSVKSYLPFLLDRLNGCGIKDRDIFIVFAKGAHRRYSSACYRAVIGEAAYKRVRVFENTAADERRYVYVGTTKRGTRVRLLKKALSADRIIATGIIGFHYFAGYTGGRKSILPGISALDTIVENHRLTMFGGEEKYASAGSYAKNPVNMDMIEAARMAGPVFMINTVLNKKGDIIRFFAGDIVAAHKKGTNYVNRICKKKISRKADLVIAGCGGYPKDINFVQAHKAIHNASYALKKGGVMVAAGACGEGYGSDIIAGYARIGRIEEIERRLAKRYEVQGQTVRAMYKKASSYRIIFASKMKPAFVRRLGMVPADTIGEAVELAVRWLPEDFGAYIIPDASVVLPVTDYGI